MRIAILILAYKNVDQLNRLVAHLAEDFGVFVHLDRKSALTAADVLTHDRVDVASKYRVYWGSFNQIRAMIDLLERAYREGYDRYLLITGQDIPIRPNSEMIEFFRDNHDEFIECTPLPCAFWFDGGLGRLTRYHANSGRGVTGVRKFAILLMRVYFKFIRSVLRVRRRLDYDFYGGEGAFNLSKGCVGHILDYISGNPSYLRRFRHTACADEIFFQTIIMNECSECSIVNASLRYADWRTGPESPRILRVSDYKQVRDSGMLFARKVDDHVDRQISDLLYADAARTAPHRGIDSSEWSVWSLSRRGTLPAALVGPPCVSEPQEPKEL
jgi:hypothetical protein